MEKIFQKLSLASASLVFIILLGIFFTLFNSSKLAIDEFGFNFITNPQWNEEVTLETSNESSKATELDRLEESSLESDVILDEDDIIADEDDMIIDEDEVMLFDEDAEETSKTIFGGLIPIVGTLLSTLIALVFALPIAMGIAVFLAEIAPKNISHVVGIAIELLAAIPSIIFGMWGLYYFAPIVADIVGGYQVSLLTAGLVLGVMIFLLWRQSQETV